MNGLTAMQLKSKESKVSECELRIIHRSMDRDGALIEIPVRAAVVEWLIPEDETGPLMSYYEIVSATEEETGDPFDRHLITEAEFCEALASEDNAILEDPEEQPIQESEI
jgi:hypothetical protein